MLQAMSQRKCLCDTSEVPILPEASRRRQDYLARLGIQKGKHVPALMCTPATKARSWSDASTSAGESVDEKSSEGLTRDRTSTEGSSDCEYEYKESAEVVEVLDLKQTDDFRVRYLRNLSNARVWVPKAQRAPSHQTVIIFDWDDTLLSTTYLSNRGDQALPAPMEKHLRGIEEVVIKLLELAMRLGNTFIITNAMEGWVQHSAAKWAPGLLDVLRKVPVISARAKYEEQFPCDISMWKIGAFLEVQRQLDSQIITNLVSLGDAQFEMDAVHRMGKEFTTAMVKTVKFQPRPSPQMLLNQLTLVHSKLEHIVEKARDLKVGLERK